MKRTFILLFALFLSVTMFAQEAMSPKTPLLFQQTTPMMQGTDGDGGLQSVILQSEDNIQYTITATAGIGGTITPKGAVQVAEGANQIFQAVPNWGYELSVIKVDGEPNADASETGIYQFTNVQANHTISAEFVKIKYTITATVEGGNGAITPGTIDVEHGNNQTFTFIPTPGFRVKEVFIDGVLNLAAVQKGSYTFTNVIQEHTIKVTFIKLTFTVTATVGVGGSINPSGIATIQYDNHSEIYVIDPEEGFRIQSVLVDGKNDALAVENGMYRFLNVKANHTIHVIFAPITYTIVASASQGGLIHPAGLVNVLQGGDKEFIFAAQAGFELVRVMVNGIDDDLAVATGRYTFTEVLANQTIAAQFERKDYNVCLPNLPTDDCPDVQDVLGAVVIPVGGSTSPVQAGGKFMFIVALVEGYTQSNIIVRANNVILNPVGGVYTINNIVIDQNVTISGVELNPNVGITGNDKSVINVFSYSNIVTIVNEELVPIKQVEIMDMYGRVVWKGQAIGDRTEIALNVATGIYNVRVITESSVSTTKVNIK